MAGNRLDVYFQRFGARLLLPHHDAFVFEAPKEHLKEVAELTSRVMCEAVQEMFPMLKPRAEINIEHPECWNKDRNVDLLWQSVRANAQKWGLSLPHRPMKPTTKKTK